MVFADFWPNHKRNPTKFSSCIVVGLLGKQEKNEENKVSVIFTNSKLVWLLNSPLEFLFSPFTPLRTKAAQIDNLSFDFISSFSCGSCLKS